MATLAISDELLRQVATLADNGGISLQEQIEVLLRESISRRASGTDLLQLMNAIAAMTPRGVAQTDSVELLREDRDR